MYVSFFCFFFFTCRHSKMLFIFPTFLVQNSKVAVKVKFVWLNIQSFIALYKQSQILL